MEEQAGRTPDQTAVVYEDSRLTYRELNERANQLARTLQSEGVQPDQPVGIMTERSLDMIVGIFGILKAGGAYVPIDPGYPEERVRYILEDSDTKLLLVQNQSQERVPFTGKVLDMKDPQNFCEDGSNVEPAAGPDHLYMLFIHRVQRASRKGLWLSTGRSSIGWCGCRKNTLSMSGMRFCKNCDHL